MNWDHAPMGNAAAEGTSQRWASARVVVAAVNMVWCATMFLWLGGLVVRSLAPGTTTVLLAGLVLSYLPQAVAMGGIAFATRWAGRVLLWVLLVQLLLFAAWLAVGGTLAPLVFGVPGLVTAFLLRRAKFGVQFEPADGSRSPTHTHIALILGVSCVLYFVVQEADTVSLELRRQQHESKCESDGSLIDCRQAAMLELRAATDFDDMREIEARFRPLCDRGNAAACRSIGYLRSDYFAYVGTPTEAIMKHLRQVSSRRCFDGDARGCAVAAWFVDNDLGRVLRKSETLCQQGQPDACLYLTQEDEPSPELREHACRAGVEVFCPDSDDPATRCLEGDLAACRAAAEENDDRALGALAAAHRELGNPGLYGFALPPGDHRVACDDGDAVACLFAGLEQLGPIHKPPAVIPSLPPRDELDATLGQSCDEGIAVACLAYGFRLLDRGIDETPDITRANTWLEKGCALGSAPACREVSFEPQLRRHEFDGYRRQMARACRATGAPPDCRAYVSLLAYDIGATPWPISDDLAHVHLRAACVQTRDPMACTNAAFLVTRLEVTPEYQLMALDLARSACKKRYAEGCHVMWWSAERWWPAYATALRDKTCEAVPTACK